jgi:hypothetical protein
MKLHKLTILPVSILLSALLAAPASAQSGQIQATLTPPPSGELTVGDPVILALAVTHPSGYQVILPELPVIWGDFTVQSQAPATTVANPDGSETTTQLIDTRLFAPGDFSTPPLEISLADPSGALLQVSVPTATVSIVSVLVDGDTALRDIKPQAELPFLNLTPWIIGGGLLALAGMGVFIWKRTLRSRAIRASIDPRLPPEVALDELARILSLGLPEQALFKDYYTLLSDCIRFYIEAAFLISAMERTTAEIHASLRAQGVDALLSGQFVSFLSTCDLVKFSKFRPDVAEAHQALASARTLIESTRDIFQTAGPGVPQDKANSSTPGGLAGPSGDQRRMEITA